MEVKLINPTDDSRIITKMEKRCLMRIFKDPRQLDMFHPASDKALEKTEQLMSVFDTINQKYGRHTIRLAADGSSKPWSMRAELKSPAYTTRRSDISRVTLH